MASVSWHGPPPPQTPINLDVSFQLNLSLDQNHYTGQSTPTPDYLHVTMDWNAPASAWYIIVGAASAAGPTYAAIKYAVSQTPGQPIVFTISAWDYIQTGATCTLSVSA